MDGKSFKQRIKDLGLVAKRVAKEMGVSEQCMTSYYGRADIRSNTLRRADKAILHLTDGKHGLFEDFTDQEPPASATPPAVSTAGTPATPPAVSTAGTPASATVPDAAASGDPAPLPDQQQALDYAARQVATMSRRLSDSLARLEARENELDKKEARLDALMERLEHRLSVISRYISANIPGAEPFIGNLDMAAEAPAPQEGKNSLYLDPLPPLSDVLMTKLAKGNKKTTK